MKTLIHIFSLLFFCYVFWELFRALMAVTISIKGFKRPFSRAESPRDFWFIWLALFIVFAGMFWAIFYPFTPKSWF